MPLVGCDGEVACLILEDLASDVVGVHLDQIGHCIVGFLGNEVNGVFWGRKSDWQLGWLGGPLSLSGLVHVALYGCIVDGDVLACLLCG